MIAFTHLSRCIEITRDDIIDATESRAACKCFLERTAAISQPKDGGPLLLLLFSRIATLACDWLDGDLRIELASQGEQTILDVQVSLGLGSAERVFPRLTLKVPFAEFLGAIDRVPQVIWPLRMKKGSKRMLLSASRDVRTSTVPPSVEIDIECQSQTIPKAPPLPLAVDTPTITFLEAPRYDASDGSTGRTVVRIRHTIPYGCELLTGTR
jgi:hypothetical protein